MAEQNQAEEQFRSALADVLAVMRKLAPLCKTVDDMVGMTQLALENDGQLALMMQAVSPLQLRK